MNAVKERIFQEIRFLTEDESWQQDPEKTKEVQRLGSMMDDKKALKKTSSQPLINLSHLLEGEISEAYDMYAYQLKTMDYIAHYFGVSGSAVSTELNKTDAKEVRERTKEKRDEAIKKERAKGRSVVYLAKKYEVGIYTAQRLAKQVQKKKPRKKVKRKNFGRPQCLIKMIDDSGTETYFPSIKELCESYKMSTTTIYNHLDNDEEVQCGNFKGYTFYRVGSQE